MRKLLIANRGEIVVRIIRTAREMGIETVAVYSEADANAPHVREADEAWCIGPAPPPKSYLNIDNIMEAVEKSGADALHPGYGFLSESQPFAQAVSEQDVTFVGPSVKTLSDIQSKCYCRKLCNELGVPVVPGTIDIVKDPEEIRRVFLEYGPPLLLKLDKGGGGKGIQIIDREENIEPVLTSSGSMGQMAFGSPDCYVEKGLKRARHIEVQFLRDHYGNVITLGERECSIQRRYQKIIEESPSPVVTPEERRHLHEWTCRLAQGMRYRNAGTIEFLRSEDGAFYFMEVNARIQVEHPVTEMVTGVDIVKCQLEIASGHRLAMKQNEIRFDGHAIEARVYAENPVSFMPSPGTISEIAFPKIKGVKSRFEHALEKGIKVSPFYDPMLAKVVAWGSTRQRSIDRLDRRLSKFMLKGIETNIPLLKIILESDPFSQGRFHTESLEPIMTKYTFDPDKNRYDRI